MYNDKERVDGGKQILLIISQLSVRRANLYTILQNSTWYSTADAVSIIFNPLLLLLSF